MPALRPSGPACDARCGRLGHAALSGAQRTTAQRPVGRARSDQALMRRSARLIRLGPGARSDPEAVVKFMNVWAEIGAPCPREGPSVYCQRRRRRMRGPVVLLVTLAAVASAMTPAPAQDLTQVFKNVSPSVVVIRTREKEVSDEGQLTKFGEVGSGVLISQDGKVMTAAHVVHLADNITVEFLGGGS